MKTRLYPTFKKISFAVILVWISISKADAQTNLVPNPSFEDTVQCPEYFGEIYYAAPWYDATGASPEYFNSCTDSIYIDVPLNFWGNQVPRTGNAYAGFGTAYDIVVDGREYLQVPLTSQLIASASYCVEFYVSLADTSSLAISSIGVYFSDTAITGPLGEVLNVMPQINNPPANFLTDKIGWTQIAGTYIANGTESFITIGNFQNDANTDTVNVGENAYSGAYYYIDDVSVELCLTETINEENNNANRGINVYPNPGNGIFTLTSNVGKGVISIYNMQGENVYESEIVNPSIEINLTNMSNGIYFIIVKSGTESFSQKIVISHE